MARRSSIGAAAIVFFAAISGCVWSDDSPLMYYGRTVRPMSDVPVRMVSETVNISFDDTTAFVECHFTFNNEGLKDTLLVGFPNYERNLPLRDFRSWVDGTEVPVARIQGDSTWVPNTYWEECSWQTFPVLFNSPGKTTEITNRYWAPLAAEDYFSLANHTCLYVLQTGSYWEGTIGEATVTAHLENIPRDRIMSLSPEGYQWVGDTVVWRFENFEPKYEDDIRIRLVPIVLYERMKEADELLNKDPDSARGHFLRGTVRFNQSMNIDANRETAEQEFLKALEYDPEMLDARFFLAVIYHYRIIWGSGRKYAEEREMLESILRKNPDYTCTDGAFPPCFAQFANANARADSWLRRLNWHQEMREREPNRHK